MSLPTEIRLPSRESTWQPTQKSAPALAGVKYCCAGALGKPKS